MSEPLEIVTARFFLRPLRETDVTERYLGWLVDPDAQKFIVTAATTKGLSDLVTYVRDRTERDDVVFLGIFDKTSGLHIGNIKYEPIDSAAGYAIMGVLIGDTDYRSQGVAPEVVAASADWLKQHRQVHQIVLGVDSENRAAIRAYERVGFVRADTPYLRRTSPEMETMIWQL